MLVLNFLQHIYWMNVFLSEEPVQLTSDCAHQMSLFFFNKLLVSIYPFANIHDYKETNRDET